MAAGHMETFEERTIVLRDKAAREGFDVPDDVIDYIAHKYSVPQSLKGALINVTAYALRRGLAVDLAIAQYVLDGIRPPKAGEAAPVTQTTRIMQGDSTDDLMNNDSSDVATESVRESNESSDQSIEESPRDFTASADTLELFPEDKEEIPAPSFMHGVTQPAAWSEDDTPVPVIEVSETHCTYESILQQAPETNQADVLDGAAAVYFAPMRTERKRSLTERAGTALIRAGLKDVIASGDRVAVKVHFGEKGNTGFVSPIFVREVVKLVKEAGGKPFLTDANTLYSGQRSNAIDHIECAIHNGFSYSTVEAPIIIADGLNGHDAIDVPINGLHFDSVRIGSAAVEADAMVVISHVKGHGEAGFGGAIKNVGMGLGSRSAKQRMHSGVKPSVTEDACVRCGRCIKWCPVACIAMGPMPEDKAFINSDACVGCGECVAACSYGAIAINWDTNADEFQEKMVEHVAGALKDKQNKTIYLSFLTNITPECDCWSFSDASVVPDIGLLASRDIVAIDQASYDMVTEAVGNAGSQGSGLESGVDKFKAMHGVDGSVAMRYAEDLRLGTRLYEIKLIG